MTKRTSKQSNKTTEFDSLTEMDKDLRNPDPVKKTKGESETNRLRQKTADTGEGAKSYPASKNVNAPD